MDGAAVAGDGSDGGGTSLYPQGAALSREAALRLHTGGGAWFGRGEDRKDRTCSECGLAFTRARVARWHRGCRRVMAWHTAALGAALSTTLYSRGGLGDAAFDATMRPRWYGAFVAFALASEGVVQWRARAIGRRTLDIHSREFTVLSTLNAVVFVVVLCGMAWLRSTASC